MLRTFIRQYSLGNKNLNKKIAIISAQISKGQDKKGTDLGPQHIKQEKLYNELRNLNYEPVDYITINDAKVENELVYHKNKNLLSLSHSNHQLSNAVNKAISEEHIPLILGGDHSIAMGSIHGSLTSKPGLCGVIWVDAHGDINTPLTTFSGNAHGQPVSFLVKEMSELVPKLKGLEWLQPCLSLKHLVYIGLRDLDADETYVLKKFNVKAFTMTDVQSLGIKKVVEESLLHLTIDGSLLPLHVSVDIDALDPWFAPSTGTPVLGGLTLTELMHIGNAVHETGIFFSSFIS